MSFLIERKGKEIGYQQIDFTELADGSLQVDIHIDIKVVMGFITFYDFLHENTEIWKDGELQSLNTRTRLAGKNSHFQSNVSTACWSSITGRAKR